MLRALKDRGMKLAILSNGTPSMLAAVVRNSGLEDVFDAVLSVEEVGVYKPHPSVYALAAQRLHCAGAHLLPVIQRLGRLFGQGLRLPGALVQPLRPTRGADSGRARWRDRRSVGHCQRMVSQ
jgi:hypothetical protein